MDARPAAATKPPTLCIILFGSIDSSGADFVLERSHGRRPRDVRSSKLDWMKTPRAPWVAAGGPSFLGAPRAPSDPFLRTPTLAIGAPPRPGHEKQRHRTSAA